MAQVPKLALTTTKDQRQALLAMDYTSSSEKAVAYLASRVLDDGWVARHSDVAYYFKAPMAFLEAGRLEDAGKALDVAAKYVKRGGADSANGAYSTQFQHYPWMWICWAATRLGREELAAECFERLTEYSHPASSSGIVAAPFKENVPFEADFFATAEVVKVAMLRSKPQLAEAAADVLLRILRANQENIKKGRFQLRWTTTLSGNFVLVQDSSDVLHCVCQHEPNQLYFMLGFPAMVLMEVADTVETAKAEACRAGALELFVFLNDCAGVFESPMAHKMGRAAAMIGDRDTAVKVFDFFVSQQSAHGNFQEDPEAMDSVDQTAEIAVWLQQSQRDLAGEVLLRAHESE